MQEIRRPRQQDGAQAGVSVSSAQHCCMHCGMRCCVHCVTKKVAKKCATARSAVGGSDKLLQLSFVLQQYDCEKVLQADRALSIIHGVRRWTSEVLTAFGGLRRSELVEPRGHNHKRITYLCWLASPLNPVSAEAAPYKAPRYHT
eukprot:1157799-Pelagomonas_calceolata.AAC.7